MLIIWRRWYFVGVLGLGLAIHGTPELALAIHTNAEPVAVELAELVAQKEIDKPFVRIGEHVALHQSGTTFRTGLRYRKERCVYPIVAPPRRDLEPPAPPHRVFVLANGRLQPTPRATVASLVGIARPLAALGDTERRVVSQLAPGDEGVVVIERDRAPHLAASLLEVLGSAVLLAWAVSLFLGGKKPPAPAPTPRA